MAAPVGAQDPAPAGPAIYKQYCSYCHDDGTAGAPRIGDRETWRPIIEKGKPTLAANAWEGKGHMPARQLRESSGLDYDKMVEALNYLIDQSK